MQLDEPFPREAIHPRVRKVILNEFQGRWPTVQEIAQISDRQWLATPGVGPTVLQQIHSVIRPPRHQDEPDLSRLTDAELLDRLEFLQEEFGRIRQILKSKIGGTSRKSLRNRNRDYVAGLS